MIPKKIIILPFLCTVIFLLYLFEVQDSALIAIHRVLKMYKKTNACADNQGILDLGDVLPCLQGPKMWFLETSGTEFVKPRQACAVESAARTNPQMKTLLLMTPEGDVDVADEFISGLINISNIYVIKLNISTIFINTPLEGWFRKGVVLKSRYKVNHLSDALRYLLLWRYGGIYLDLDVVVLRSMSHLRNFTVLENFNRAAPGVMGFDRGHGLMALCMTQMAKNYRSLDWAFNGPPLLTQSIRDWCRVYNLERVSPKRCNVRVLPSRAAYPIGWKTWSQYFRNISVHNITSYFPRSYVIHVWNKYSVRKMLYHNTTTLYQLAFQEHCPTVYRIVQSMDAYK